jgi:four helix bundle protein
MADRVDNFEQLEAWRTARELVRSVYSVSRQQPAALDFGLRDQVQRAAISAMTNVAESFEGIPGAEKLQFCAIARASSGEVRSLSYVMLDAGCISGTEHQAQLEFVAQTRRLVSGLIQSTRARTPNP